MFSYVNGNSKVAQQVQQSIKEIIELADCDALDVSPSAKPCGYSRTVSLQVLDILDQPETR